MSSSNPKQNIRPPNPEKNIKPLVFKLNIRKSKPCKLVVGSLENIVAHGTMYERTRPQEVIHTVPLGKFNVRVSVDVAIVKDAPLPIPIPEEMTIVGEAIGCQVAWPKKIILVNNEGALKDVDCEKRLECIPAFASLVGNEGNSKNVDFEKKLESIHVFESLVEHFKYDEAINIPLEKDIDQCTTSKSRHGVCMSNERAIHYMHHVVHKSFPSSVKSVEFGQNICHC